jgi:hypothetical protein
MAKPKHHKTRNLLFDDNGALGRLRIELAEKRIATWLQRADEYGNTTLPADNLFPIQFVTFKLFRCGIVIDDNQLYFGLGRNGNFSRNETMVPNVPSKIKKQASKNFDIKDSIDLNNDFRIQFNFFVVRQSEQTHPYQHDVYSDCIKNQLHASRRGTVPNKDVECFSQK